MKNLSIGIVILSILIGIVYLFSQDSRISEQSSKAINKSHLLKRQDFSLADLNGQQQQFSQWNNKVVLLNFWATWCPPCRREMPDFIEIYKQYQDEDFIVIGVGIDDQKKIADFVQQLAVNYPILVGGQSAMQVSYQYGNHSSALPYSILIDKRGTIRYRAGGYISKKKLINLIEPLL